MAEWSPNGDNRNEDPRQSGRKGSRNELLDSFEVIPRAKYDYRRCRIKLPALITIQCYCLNSDQVHTEVLRISELPNTVLDLKQLISDSLSIPVICQLRLSVKDIYLFDDQIFAEEVPFREGDEVKLEYFGRCSEKMEQLVNQGKCITKFCSDYELTNYFRCESIPNMTAGEDKGKKTKKNNFLTYLKKAKILRLPRKHSNNSDCGSPPPFNMDEMKRDAATVRWALANLYSDVLLPWRDEGTLCHRLYMVQEELIDRILDVWKWARENSDLNLQRVCMLSLWDYGENLAERMYLLLRDVHTEALDVYLESGVDDDTKYAAIGLIAGFGEFPLGQSVIGVNEEFLKVTAEYLCTTRSSFIETVIGGLLLSLASYHSVPKHMSNVRILENIKSLVDTLSFSSVDDFDLTYLLILLFMFLLKSPDFKTPEGYSVKLFAQYFIDFHTNVTDDLIAESEQDKQTSWASMVPFIDLFFVSKGSVMIESGNSDFLSAYLRCAETLFSAMMLQEENLQLFLNEDLYGYLICLSWYYKNDSTVCNFIKDVLARFKPIPYKIPSLLHIATATYAFTTKGLGAAIEVVSCVGVTK